MTVRAPVYWNSAGPLSSIKEMGPAEIESVIQRIVYLSYGVKYDPAITLSVDGSIGHSGDLFRMLDTRDSPGAEKNNATSFANNTSGLASTTDGTEVLTYDRIDQQDGTTVITSDTGFDYSAYISSSTFRVNNGWDDTAGEAVSGMPAVDDVIAFTNSSGESVGSTLGGTDFTVTSVSQNGTGSSHAEVTVNRSTLPGLVQPALDVGSSILIVTNPGGAQNLDTTGLVYPLYLDGTNGLKAMTRADFKDTFIYPAIIRIADGSEHDGTYTIQSEETTYAGHTLVSATPVYFDSRFNATGVHGGATGTSEQEILPLSYSSEEIQKWWLWRANQGNSYGNPSTVKPLLADADGNLVEFSSSAWDDLLEGLTSYTASRITGDSVYKISYEIKKLNGPGDPNFPSLSPAPYSQAQKGDVITDTTLNAQVRINDQDGADTYRSQNLPTGSAEVETTYRLSILRR